MSTDRSNQTEEQLGLVADGDETYQDARRISAASRPGISRIKKLGVLILTVAGLIIGVVLGLAKLSAPTTPLSREYVPGSHAAFVNYDAVTPHQSLSDNPPLCDHAIVNMTCKALNAETLGIGSGNAIDIDNRYIHAIELQEVLSASKASIVSFFNHPKLRLTNWDPKTPDAFAVSCQELCEKLVATYPPKILTSVSNVGCYWEDFKLEPTCDVDVSHAALNQISFPDRPQAKMGAEYLETSAMKAADPESEHREQIDAALNNAMNPTNAQAAIIHNLTYHDQDFDTLRSNLLNMFHIHPAIHSKTQDGFSLLGPIEPATPTRRAEAKIPIDPRIDRQLSIKDDSCQTAHDGSCDYANGACAPGTDCSDCRDCDKTMMSKTNADTCQYARDGACDEPPHSPFYCYAGTDCTDCKNCAGSGGNPASNLPNADSAWKRTTLQRAVKAKAYISTVLQKMASRKIGTVVDKWYGNNLDYPTRSEIKRIANSVRSMLNNVDYVYPGDQCSENTYAYVYPSSPWNKNTAGKFIFYLCNYYMKVGEGEQIETLTHEGSHHVSARTDDSKSPINGQTMYGRPSCQAVANLCRQKGSNSGSCTLARKNADTFCYFINDGYVAPGTGVGSTRRRSPQGRRRAPPPTRRRRWFWR